MRISTKQITLGFALIALLGLFLLSANSAPLNAQAPAGAVAYGYILENGSNETSTFNVSSTFYDFDAGQYEITIDAVDYFYSDFVAVVTPASTRSGEPVIASTSSVNGHLLVILQDVDGNHVQDDFQFVIYRP